VGEGRDLADLAIALGILGFAVFWPLRGILAALNWVVMPPGEVGLVYRFGRLRRELPPGRHLLGFGATLRRVVTIPQTLHVRGPETTTRDGWPVELWAVVTFQVAEGQARAAAEGDVLAPAERVRHAVALALAELADRTDLAALLGSRAARDEALAGAIGESVLPPALRIVRARLSRVRYPPLARRHLARLAAGLPGTARM
jgi:regulator of protease activity HflC (stomatin/prohibitin superfamily)